MADELCGLTPNEARSSASTAELEWWRMRVGRG